MAWVSPTGHNDPDSKWSTEANAYDEDTDTHAWTFQDGYYLELTLESAISCDKVRSWWSTSTGDADVNIDVYYSGAWHNIHSRVIGKGDWVESSLGSTQTVEKARVKLNAFRTHYLKEFDFNEVSGGTTHYGAAALSGAGALSSLARLTLAARATASGTGALSAAAGLVLPGTATLSAVGSLAAAGTIEGAVKYGAATLSGAGSLAASASKILSGAATMAGEGSLAAAGTIEGVIKYGTATLSATGTLTTIGGIVFSAAASLAGTGSLAASAVLTLAAKALIEGTGSLSAISSLLGDVFGKATLKGQGFLSVSAESWHILTSREYQDLLQGQIEFQEI